MIDNVEELVADMKAPRFENGQVVYERSQKDIQWSFGCYHPNGVAAIILSDTGYGYSTLENLSATPFKTEEELHREKAEKEKLDYMLMAISESGIVECASDIDAVLEFMQANGFLVDAAKPSGLD